jgi:hypothetical protein
MRVTRVLKLWEYDRAAQAELPGKVPDMNSADPVRRVGDAIYDFSVDPPRQRASVHVPSNAPIDLSGVNVLLSSDFYYFGNQPIPLPDELAGIVRQGQGHRSTANQPFLIPFESWIRSLGVPPGTLIGRPQLDLWDAPELRARCAAARAEDDRADREHDRTTAHA